MATLQVFFDYACPYCLAGHQNLTELMPQHPDIEIEWCPCEAHPRPEQHSPHSDLCFRAMFYARERGIDLWKCHQRIYAACLTDRINIEDIDALAEYMGDLVDAEALNAALREGRYETELQGPTTKPMSKTVYGRCPLPHERPQTGCRGGSGRIEGTAKSVSECLGERKRFTTPRLCLA